MTACLIRGRRFFNGKKFYADRKEKQMQGFRTYNLPDGMLLLHSGSIEKTECEKDVNALLDKKAG